MTTPHESPSPSPPPAVPQANLEAATSYHFTQLRKLYTTALRHTLETNSYPNFASCFPTPAAYCPRALEGVWKQLNNRLEEECTKDFEKICVERDLQRGLGTWEKLLDDAKERQSQSANKEQDEGVKPLHLLSAQELHAAHLAPTLVKAEKELQSKLDAVQNNNQNVLGKIEQQRAEIRTLVEQLESMIEDVEGAAKSFEDDSMRAELSTGSGSVGEQDGDDIKMGG